MKPNSAIDTAICEIWELPVIVLGHLSEAQRRALVIADNQLALNAGWDEELLRIELAFLQDADYDLSIVGLDDIELQRLLEVQDAAEGLTDEDAVPELPETPTTHPRRRLDTRRPSCSLRGRHSAGRCGCPYRRRSHGSGFHGSTVQR